MTVARAVSVLLEDRWITLNRAVGLIRRRLFLDVVFRGFGNTQPFSRLFGGRCPSVFINDATEECLRLSCLVQFAGIQIREVNGGPAPAIRREGFS